MKSQMCTKHVGIRLILVLVVCYYFLYNVSLPKLVLESHTSNYLKKNNKGAITNFLFSGKGMGSYEVTKDIDLMIKEIKEKFVLTRPLISSHNVSCSYKTKSVDSIEDLLCMPPPTFSKELKNPCWYSEGQRFNCLPYFQLIGCVKCASTDLFDRIINHPDILENSGYGHKETMWWALQRYGLNINGGQRRRKTFEEYLKYFKESAYVIQTNPQRGYITGDGSSYDFVGNLGWNFIPQNQGLNEPKYVTPYLIRHINPDVKILVILRDPVERLFSDYVFRCHNNASAENFHQGVLKSIRLLHTCTLKNTLRTCLYDRQLYRQLIKLKVRIVWGFYAVFLQDWFNVFPRNQILILQTEEYSQNMTKQLNKVYSFLGVRVTTG